MGWAADAQRRQDRGSVTVETALVLPVLVIVFVLCLGGIGCVSAQMRCADAASEAARLYGRGDEVGAREAVARLAPAGSLVSFSVEGDVVRVVVQAKPFGSILPVLEVDADAVAAMEDAAQVGGR